MERTLRGWAAGLTLGLLALGLPALAAEPGAKAAKKADAPEKKAVEEKFVLDGPIVVKLEEVPAFGKEEIGGATRFRYPRGQYARCTTRPSKQVKAYPKLKSKKPLYGSVTLDGSYYDTSAGTTLYFVLDESGEGPKPAKPPKEKKETKEKKEKQKKAAEGTKGGPAAKALASRAIAIKESLGVAPSAGATYDRLYVDLNGDLDLTNDGVLKPAAKPPFEGLGQRSAVRCFEDAVLPVDLGPPWGKRPFAIVPQAHTYGSGQGYVYFLPKTARRGTVRLGSRSYTVYLTQSQIISGRFDRPSVQLELVPEAGASGKALPLAPGWLGTLRVVDGRYVTVTATPPGDRLTIEPYRGELGVLKVGSGGRAITQLGVAGDFTSRSLMVPVSDRMLMLSDEPPRRVELPVGDYMPAYLNVRYGQLRFSCRALTPSATDDQAPKGPDYAIKIRKDKPFLLEFSGKPSVDISSPGKGQSFKPGQTVPLRAMLSEPTQGIQITGLYDLRKRTGETTYRTGTERVTMPKYDRLDPSVVIRNAKGEEVASGKMPFG